MFDDQPAMTIDDQCMYRILSDICRKHNTSMRIVSISTIGGQISKHFKARLYDDDVSFSCVPIEGWPHEITLNDQHGALILTLSINPIGSKAVCQAGNGVGMDEIFEIIKDLARMYS